ncbi:MAG: LEA type 2 family protein [Steroidobacteraceae bacterium]
MHCRRALLLLMTALALGGCASLPHRDPLQVTVADMEALPGEGMEVRMLVKLRVQNPNSAEIAYSGAYLEFEVQGRTFATGVSDQGGVIPPFGEAIVAVPVTVSVLRMVRQVAGMLDGQPVDSIRYQMSGKLGGGLFSTERFSVSGEFSLPQLQKPAPAPPDAG